MSNKKTLAQMSESEAALAGISSLADRPNDASRYGDGGLTAKALKERFDALPNLVRQKFNEIATMLTAADAAKYIGLDGSVGGVDNLYDFLLLFGERGDGAQDKNISDYIETLYQGEEEDEATSHTLRDIVQSIVSRFADVERDKGEKVALEVADEGTVTVKLLNVANAVLGEATAGGPAKTAGIANDAVTNVKLADDAVITEKIKNAAVTTVKLADDAVITEKIKNAAVTTEKLGEKSVTAEKLSDDVSGRITGLENGDFTRADYNAENGELTFFAKDGSKKATVNLPLDLVVTNGRFDTANKDIVLVLSNGKSIPIPLDDFVDTAIAELKRIDAKLPAPTGSDEGRFLKASGGKIVFSDIGVSQFPKLRAPLSVTVDSRGMTVKTENHNSPFVLKNYVYIDGERVGTMAEGEVFNFSGFIGDKVLVEVGVTAAGENFKESDKTFAVWGLTNGTEGLTYSGQTCTGIGAATESEIEIASYHNGVPVKDIASSAFYDNKRITSIYIPDSVIDIHNSAFYGCTSLTSVRMPEGNYVGDIGNNTFYGCEALKSITIPYGATRLGDCAFKGCSSLTSVTIPDSVTTIYSESFAGCSSLTSVTIPDSVIKINSNAFRDCKALTSITIPGGVKTIGSYTFYGCTALTNVTISNGVTSIAYYAFEGCFSLTSITIPASVTNFSPRVFLNCSSLKTVIFKGMPTSIASAVFENCASLTDIYVPWSEGEVANAPWGATNATIHYNSEG